MMRPITSWFKRLFGRQRAEQDLDRELAYHMERREQELIEQGATPAAAHRQVRLEFGGSDQIKEECRDARGTRWLEDFFRDVRYGLRVLRKSPVFTGAAVLSLALGIGANTAIFSFIDAVFLRPLPVRDPDQLVVMKWRDPASTMLVGNDISFTTSTGGGGDQVYTMFAFPTVDLFAGNTKILDRVFAYFCAERLTVSFGAEAESVPGQFVTGNYFPGIGTTAAAGRLLEEADDRPGATPVVVLSYAFARRHYASIGDAIGGNVRANNQLFTVVGVTPQEFFGVEPSRVPDLYLPMRSNTVLDSETMQGADRYRADNYLWTAIMGRLRPGVSRDVAQEALQSQFHAYLKHSLTGENNPEDLPVLVVQDGSSGMDSLRLTYATQFYVLIAMVVVVLALACINVATLLLARSVSRERELAARVSLGAGSGRVARQLLTESLLLALAGGLGGVLVAYFGIRFLTALLADGQPNFTLHAELNWIALSVTLALSVVTGLLFGLAPVIRSIGLDKVSLLTSGNSTGSMGKRSATGKVQKRLGQALVGVQIAFSVVLLILAGLLVQTMRNLYSIDLGFNRDQVLLFSINAEDAGYAKPVLSGIFQRLLTRFEAIPGVQQASYSSRALPTLGGSYSVFTVPGATRGELKTDPKDGAAGVPPEFSGVLSVGPGFFKTMQIPILAGREFDERDIEGAPPVVVVSQKFVEFWGLNAAVGQTVASRGNLQYQIAGVTGDAAFINLKNDPRPMVYFPLSQGAPNLSEVTFELRTSGDALSLASAVREMVRREDPLLAVAGLQTEMDRINQTMSQEIALARIGGLFAVVSLLLACIGLYGTMAHNVATRTGEFGIRIALGARRSRILWSVLRQVILISLAGLAAGTVAAIAASRLVQSFLWQLEPTDPFVLAFSSLLLGIAVLLAGMIPAWRAARIDPAEALRSE